MKGMGQEGHRERAGRGQARLPPSQNSKTPSGTRSHKMQNKKGGDMDMDSLGRG